MEEQPPLADSPVKYSLQCWKINLCCSTCTWHLQCDTTLNPNVVQSSPMFRLSATLCICTLTKHLIQAQCFFVRPKRGPISELLRTPSLYFH